MEVINLTQSADRSFTDQVRQESGQDLVQCYQCGNCTAGCPLSADFDLPVHQIMRLTQAGIKEQALGSRSIWLCATCETCTTRCPNNIDVARIMDVLRHMARREDNVAEKLVKLFHDSFLESVKKHGRVFEMGLLMNYNLRSFNFLADAELGPKLMLKGKLSPKAHEIQGKDAVARIFERFEQAKGGE